jgi:hypothetical protein
VYFVFATERSSHPSYTLPLPFSQELEEPKFIEEPPAVQHGQGKVIAILTSGGDAPGSLFAWLTYAVEA